MEVTWYFKVSKLGLFKNCRYLVLRSLIVVVGVVMIVIVVAVVGRPLQSLT